MLNPVFEAIQPPGSLSFQMRTFGQEAFEAPFHFHPEYELTLITSGEGRRYVGDRMNSFSAGDLVMLGANLPHCWKTETMRGSRSRIPAGTKSAGAVVIQFAAGFLGNDFFSRPELTFIQKLLTQSRTGILFFGKTRSLAEKMIRSIAREKNNFEKMIGLLQILQLLAVSGECELLAPQMNILSGREDRQKINPVFAYIIEHFREKICLDDAAKAVHMTPNAFCKYFKKITRKTFMETVTEYRLNYAAGRLVHTDKPVSSICFESGFGDVSHFNKTFKLKMQVSPLQYRKKFMH
jgi:AraC-like DNA-binding protein